MRAAVAGRVYPSTPWGRSRKKGESSRILAMEPARVVSNTVASEHNATLCKSTTYVIKYILDELYCICKR